MGKPASRYHTIESSPLPVHQEILQSFDSASFHRPPNPDTAQGSFSLRPPMRRNSHVWLTLVTSVQTTLPGGTALPRQVLPSSCFQGYGDPARPGATSVRARCGSRRIRDYKVWAEASISRLGWLNWITPSDIIFHTMRDSWLGKLARAQRRAVRDVKYGARIPTSVGASAFPLTSVRIRVQGHFPSDPLSLGVRSTSRRNRPPDLIGLFLPFALLPNLVLFSSHSRYLAGAQVCFLRT